MNAPSYGVLLPLALWLGYAVYRHAQRPFLRLLMRPDNSSKLKRLTDNTPALHDYDPTPFHMIDAYGTLSTILPYFIQTKAKKKASDTYHFRRQQLKLKDGGTIALDWLQSGPPPELNTATSQPPSVNAEETAASQTTSAKVTPTTATPPPTFQPAVIPIEFPPPPPPSSSSSGQKNNIVIIQHGLCGSSSSHYVLNLCEMVLRRETNVEVVVMVARGCGGLKLTTPEGFHAARTSDFAQALEFLKSFRPQANVYAVGFSLGAAILAKYLGDYGTQAAVSAAVCLSPPWDFHRTPPAFGIWSSLHLVRGLKQWAIQNQNELCQSPKVNFANVHKVKNVREFDAAFVVPIFGFRDVDDYYTQASPKRNAKNISVPTLAISAMDDPVCAWEGANFTQDELGPGLVVALTRTGGHLAFAEGLLPRTESWMERVALDWIQANIKLRSD